MTDAEDPRRFIGHTVLARPEMDAPDEKITIFSIQGSVRHEKFFEINGTHWVSMFSFFTQMLEGRVPTTAELEEFETATQITKIKEIKDGKKKNG